MLHVPYKGGGPALIDVLGGRVPIIVLTGGSDVARAPGSCSR
jgi:tripartite-type tricarboxylate transporter receptor subunit TctC